MEYKTKYNIGDIVFLITDCEQLNRIVTGILIRPSGTVYYLTNGVNETMHYELEMASEKTFIL